MSAIRAISATIPKPSPATCWCRCRAAARCLWARSPRSQPTRGPNAIRTENGQLAVYIYVDIQGRDLGGYVADAQKAVADNVKFPPGYLRQWSGQFEYHASAPSRS